MAAKNLDPSAEIRKTEDMLSDMLSQLEALRSVTQTAEQTQAGAEATINASKAVIEGVERLHKDTETIEQHARGVLDDLEDLRLPEQMQEIREHFEEINQRHKESMETLEQEFRRSLEDISETLKDIPGQLHDRLNDSIVNLQTLMDDVLTRHREHSEAGWEQFRQTLTEYIDGKTQSLTDEIGTINRNLSESFGTLSGRITAIQDAIHRELSDIEGHIGTEAETTRDEVGDVRERVQHQAGQQRLLVILSSLNLAGVVAIFLYLLLRS